jgi:hypothetical protein
MYGLGNAGDDANIAYCDEAYADQGGNAGIAGPNHDGCWKAVQRDFCRAFPGECRNGLAISASWIDQANRALAVYRASKQGAVAPGAAKPVGSSNWYLYVLGLGVVGVGAYFLFGKKLFKRKPVIAGLLSGHRGHKSRKSSRKSRK